MRCQVGVVGKVVFMAGVTVLFKAACRTALLEFQVLVSCRGSGIMKCLHLGCCGFRFELVVMSFEHGILSPNCQQDLFHHWKDLLTICSYLPKVFCMITIWHHGNVRGSIRPGMCVYRCCWVLGLVWLGMGWSGFGIWQQASA